MKQLLITLVILNSCLPAAAQWAQLPSGTTSMLQSVYFTDAQTGYITGNGGLIRKTTDGGLTWSAQMSGVTDDLFEVHFPAPDTGYAVGFNCTLIKTTLTTGKSEDVLSNVRVYPNPVKDILYLVFPPTLREPVVLNLYNSMGARIQQEQRTSPCSEPVNIAQHPSGVYFLEIISSSRRRIQKIVWE